VDISFALAVFYKAVNSQQNVRTAEHLTPKFWKEIKWYRWRKLFQMKISMIL